MTQTEEAYEIKDVTHEVKQRSIDEAILEESYVEEVVLTEEERKRLEYDNIYPEALVEETIHIDAFYLHEMKVEKDKESKKGNIYTSSKCTLVCYTDEDKMRIPFFIENFKDYNPETGRLKVSGKNVLARLIKKIKGDSCESNSFVLNYEILREIINETTDIDITIEEIVGVDGFKNYTIK